MAAIVSANLLDTGRVVFLGREGAWVAAIAEAVVYGDAAAAEAGLAAAQRRDGGRTVVEPFVTGYTEADRRADHESLPAGRPTMTLRDTIRAHGPTVVYGRRATPRGS